MRLPWLVALTLALALTLMAGDVPRPAAPLSFTTIDGKKMSLEELRGKVVVVMFFNTTCPHCQKTTQILNPLYEQWKSRGLEIVGLALNPSASGDLGGFAKDYQAKFLLGLSTRSECTRFAEVPLMARFYVPYMFFIDRQGMVREEHAGQDREFYLKQEENIRNLLDSLLKEPPKSKKSAS
jgi:peroxiredoxin